MFRTIVQPTRFPSKAKDLVIGINAVQLSLSILAFHIAKAIGAFFSFHVAVFKFWLFQFLSLLFYPKFHLIHSFCTFTPLPNYRLIPSPAALRSLFRSWLASTCSFTQVYCQYWLHLKSRCIFSQKFFI